MIIHYKKVIAALLTMTIIAISGVFLNSCQKEEILNNTKQEQVEIGKELKFPRCDGFMLPNGQVYPANSSTFYLLEMYGGVYWYDDDGGNRHGYWPQTGEPFTHPGSGYTPPPPPPVPPIGKFVQNTIIDIMNAPIEERRYIVTANMEKPYHSCVSLNAKISENLLDKVESGEYLISEITENYSVNSDEIIFYYFIYFFNPTDVTTIEDKVSFVFKKSEVVEPETPVGLTVPFGE